MNEVDKNKKIPITNIDTYRIMNKEIPATYSIIEDFLLMMASKGSFESKIIHYGDLFRIEVNMKTILLKASDLKEIGDKFPNSVFQDNMIVMVVKK